MSDREAGRFAIHSLRHLRAVYFAGELRSRQSRALARLEKVEEIASRMGIGRNSIRREFGRTIVPGLPAAQLDFDAIEMLALPSEDREQVDGQLVRRALGRLPMEEPPSVPPWLTPGETRNAH